MIQNIFKELDPYLRGLKIAENYNIVEVLLKKSWTYKDFLPEDIQFSQTKEHSNKNYYHGALYSENKNFDQMIEILKDIVEKNLEEEEKERLLSSKVEELKKMFQETSLDKLKDLSFNYNTKFNGSTQELQLQEESK
jgi:hypothetical protein